MASYKGKYVPQNKEKYRGRWDKITYRSSWELFLMKKFDIDTNVKWWNSEEAVIPYFSNADGKKRRYFMDFMVEYTNGDVYLFEVKPDKETRPPVKPVRMTTKAKQRFMNEYYTYSVNIDKWKAACELSQKKGWKFKIITENTLKSFGWKGGNR